MSGTLTVTAYLVIFEEERSGRLAVNSIRFCVDMQDLSGADLIDGPLDELQVGDAAVVKPKVPAAMLSMFSTTEEPSEPEEVKTLELCFKPDFKNRFLLDATATASTHAAAAAAAAAATPSPSSGAGPSGVGSPSAAASGGGGGGGGGGGADNKSLLSSPVAASAGQQLPISPASQSTLTNAKTQEDVKSFFKPIVKFRGDARKYVMLATPQYVS